MSAGVKLGKWWGQAAELSGGGGGSFLSVALFLQNILMTLGTRRGRAQTGKRGFGSKQENRTVHWTCIPEAGLTLLCYDRREARLPASKTPNRSVRRGPLGVLVTEEMINT